MYPVDEYLPATATASFSVAISALESTADITGDVLHHMQQLYIKGYDIDDTGGSSNTTTWIGPIGLVAHSRNWCRAYVFTDCTAVFCCCSSRRQRQRRRPKQGDTTCRITTVRSTRVRSLGLPVAPMPTTQQGRREAKQKSGHTKLIPTPPKLRVLNRCDNF